MFEIVFGNVLEFGAILGGIAFKGAMAFVAAKFVELQLLKI
ncbi:MAG: hypothetical protein AB1763_05875 [Campylobacterota bacterium]